ncbi:MAG: signal peptidase I [Nitrosopumilaceae archaeon]
MKKRSAFYRIGKDVLIVILGVIIIWTGLRVAFGTENPFYVVSSGSMEPELNVFDVLVVQGNEPFEDIKKGDIIVFDRPSGHDRVIVHRVVDIINDDPYTIKTKGDANPASIPGTDFPVTDEEYIGKVVSIIPQIGFVTRILTPPINYIIIAVIVGIMIFRQVSKSRKKPSTVQFGDQPSTSDLEIDKDQSLLPDSFSMQDNEYTKTDEMGRDLDSKGSEKKDD